MWRKIHSRYVWCQPIRCETCAAILISLQLGPKIPWHLVTSSCSASWGTSLKKCLHQNTPHNSNVHLCNVYIGFQVSQFGPWAVLYFCMAEFRRKKKEINRYDGIEIRVHIFWLVILRSQYFERRICKAYSFGMPNSQFSPKLYLKYD